MTADVELDAVSALRRFGIPAALPAATVPAVAAPEATVLRGRGPG